MLFSKEETRLHDQRPFYVVFNQGAFYISSCFQPAGEEEAGGLVLDQGLFLLYA